MRGYAKSKEKLYDLNFKVPYRFRHNLKLRVVLEGKSMRQLQTDMFKEHELATSASSHD